MEDVDENVDMEEDYEQEGPLEARPTIRAVYIRLRYAAINALQAGEIRELQEALEVAENLLVIALAMYAEDDLDDEDILMVILLYQTLEEELLGLVNWVRPRPAVVPVDNKDRLIASLSVDEAWALGGFTHDHMNQIFNSLNLPEIISVPGSITFPSEYGFVAVCAFLSGYCRTQTSAQAFLGRTYDQISRVTQNTLLEIIERHAQKVYSPAFLLSRAETSNMIFEQKFRDNPNNPDGDDLPEELEGIAIIADGLFIKSTRSKVGQAAFYNGYRRGHGILFQGYVVADGIIVLAGPFPGYMTDIVAHAHSDVRQRLHVINNQREDNGHHRLKMLCDKIYPVSVDTHALYSNMHNHVVTERELALNTVASSVRIAVETSFGKLQEKWSFLREWRTHQLLKRNVVAWLTVAALLCNMHTCLAGSQVYSMMNLAAPTLDEFMNFPGWAEEDFAFDPDEVFGEDGIDHGAEWLIFNE